MSWLHWLYFGSRVEENKMVSSGRYSGSKSHTPGAGQLPQAGAISADLPDVPVLTRVPAQREYDLPGSEMHFRIASDAFRHVKDRPGPAAVAEINELQGAATFEVARVGLVGMKERVNRMVAAAVLWAHDVQDGLTTDERIGDQRLPLQLDELSNSVEIGVVTPTLFGLLESRQELRAAQVAIPEG